jgi:periplasmic divalent cation tolerance protein
MSDSEASSSLLVVLCNCSPGASPGIAEALVRERLAACVNVIRGVTSYYEWEGEFCEDAEHTLLIKTTADRYESMKRRLEELHPYDTPEIVATEASDVLDSYLDWVVDQTREVR